MNDSETRPALPPGMESGPRAALEGTTDSVLMVSADWRLMFLNHRAEQQLANGRDLLSRNRWDAFTGATDGAMARLSALHE